MLERSRISCAIPSVIVGERPSDRAFTITNSVQVAQEADFSGRRPTAELAVSRDSVRRRMLHGDVASYTLWQIRASFRGFLERAYRDKLHGDARKPAKKVNRGQQTSRIFTRA